MMVTVASVAAVVKVSVLVRLDSEAFKLVRVMIELEASRVLASGPRSSSLT
jgi:hypothetical protein